MIIAVDGPAGAGKSTVAKLLAKRLGFVYIDTGAMYRAITLKALDAGIDVKDSAKIIESSRNSNIDLLNSPDGSLQVLIDGKDVSKEIRHPRITRLVSDIARIQEVREIMLGLQRRLGQRGDIVVDGRDIGTVVFPQADRKFFIDAVFAERVRRRHRELVESGQEVTASEISDDLKNRDTIDSTREVAPLKKADDAIYIDTTTMSIEEVVEELLSFIR